MIKSEAGVFMVKSDMTQSTVNRLLAESLPILLEMPTWDLNLSCVAKADSAGIALMLAWMRIAKEKKIHLKFSHLPKAMVDLARVSGVDALLPIVNF